MVVLVEAKDGGPMSQRGSIYIQTRPRYTRDSCPAPLVINKRKSSTATLRHYITKPQVSVVCIFCPLVTATHTTSQQLYNNMSGRGKGGKVCSFAIYSLHRFTLLLGTRKGWS